MGTCVLKGTGAMETSGDIREDLENLKRKYGFKEPDRGDLEDQSILWRSGKPDYSKVRRKLHNQRKGKTRYFGSDQAAAIRG